MRRLVGVACASVAMAALGAASASAAVTPGSRPSDAEWAQTLAAAGQWQDLATALAVMFAESGGNPMARNPSGARGAWQFMGNTLADDNCAYDPVCSTKAAFDVSAHGTDWHRWEAYTGPSGRGSSGAWQGQVARAQAAIAAAGQAPPQPASAASQPGPIPAQPAPTPPPQSPSGAGPAPGNTAGLGIDGMVPAPPLQGGNQPLLYERYHALDYTPLHMDVLALAQNAFFQLLGGQGFEAGMNTYFNMVASEGVGLLLAIGTVVTRLLAWSLRVDLLSGADGPLNAVVGGLARDLYQPLLGLLLTVVAGWLMWTWLIRRRTMRGLVGVGWVFLAMSVAAVYFSAPSQVLDQGSAFASSISRVILGSIGAADAQVTQRGAPTVSQGAPEDAELRLFNDRFWSVYVYQPWTTAEFGRIDPKGASGGQLGQELLEKQAGRSSAFDSDIGQQPQEVKDWYNGARGGERLLVVIAALLVAIPAAFVFLAAAVAKLAAVIVFLALLMAAPVILLMAIHPTVGRALMVRWLVLVAGTLWRQVLYTLVLALMVVLVGVISSAAALGGWGLVALCELAGMGAVLVYRKPLLSLFGQMAGVSHRTLRQEHVGASRLAEGAHSGLGLARRQLPTPAFSRSSGAKAVGGSTAKGAVRVGGNRAASGAGLAAAGGASGGLALAGAVALKGGQMAIRKAEVTKRRLQGAVDPFLVDGSKRPAPPRRMSDHALGVDGKALAGWAWSRATRQPQPRFAVSAPSGNGEAEKSSLSAPAAPVPQALPAARWTRDARTGGHILERPNGNGPS